MVNVSRVICVGVSEYMYVQFRLGSSDRKLVAGLCFRATNHLLVSSTAIKAKLTYLFLESVLIKRSIVNRAAFILQ